MEKQRRATVLADQLLSELFATTGGPVELVDSSTVSRADISACTTGTPLPRSHFGHPIGPPAVAGSATMQTSTCPSVDGHNTMVSASVSTIVCTGLATNYPTIYRTPSAAGRGLPDHDEVRQCLERILTMHEQLRDLRIRLALAEAGYVDPKKMPAGGAILDRTKLAQFTALARRPGSSLGEVVRLIRGETQADPRPNKALRPSDYRWLLHGYVHAPFMIASASEGLQPTWLREAPNQVVRPPNHHSAVRFAQAVAKSVRAGQDAGQYLVVDDSMLLRWPDVQVSPLGAVEKSGIDPADEVRLIHDLKRPEGASTNEATDRSDLPRFTYVPVSRLARRIEWLYAKNPERLIRMMKGDIKGAFRHLMVHWRSVRWMGALLPMFAALVVDLSAPFGWTSSPTYYGAYGGAVTWLVQQESPATIGGDEEDSECFFAYEWVDDHVLIEHDVGDRLQSAAVALRLGMMAIFGPRAMNEKKFSSWESRLEVLGLEFDLEQRTVSMPTRKIDKACARVSALIGRARVTRSELLKLLGSLRHVCTCCRAAKPFFQRVQSLSVAAPRHGSIAVPDGVQQDLQWSLRLLQSGRFRDLPTAMFGSWPTPDIHLYMDASNVGLAVLDPATRRYIQLRFDDEELMLIARPSAVDGFTINVREQLSIALAATVWGPSWHSRFASSIGQVWCWVDNTTAATVTNKLSSRNAQELNRHVGLSEAVHGFRIRCIHLPGKMNVMADAASRLDPRHDPNDPAAPLRAVLQQLQRHGVAPSTSRKYDGSWNQWVEWCGQYDWSPWLHSEQPRHSEQLALFATFCWSQPPQGLGNAPSTVLSKLSAISWRHRLELGYPVGLHPGHLLAVQGMRRVSPPPAAKAPATVPLLRAVRARCDFAVTHDRVLWGATIVGFFFMLRSAEYLHTNGSVSPTAVTMGDITCRDRRGALTTHVDDVVRVDLRLRGSKTDQEGRSVVLSHERSGSGWLCPVLAVLDLMSHGATHGFQSTTPLCSVHDGLTIKAADLITLLRHAASDCGIEPSRMGTHSLRIGGATAMMAAGVDRQIIMQFGRWASDSVNRYTRITAGATRTLATKMTARGTNPVARGQHAGGKRPPRPPQSGRRCLGSTRL